jgi:hypothetical protein
VPFADKPIELITGFCNEDAKLFGPFQEYVAPAGIIVKLKFWPAHSGELPVMVGVAGIGFTVTPTVAKGLIQPFMVWLTEYIPAARVEAVVIVGF